MKEILLYTLGSFLLTMVIAPVLITLLYRLKIVRKLETDFASIVGERYQKAGTPIMGGLLVVVSVTLITLIFNWNGNTYIPIAVFLLSAALGGVDDVLNIYGKKRVFRTVSKQIKLAKVHKSPLYRAYYWITLPWTFYKNIWFALGSYPGNGVHAGEKIVIQLLVGAFLAWWLYFKLGWSAVWIPFIGDIQLGLLMPLFILFVTTSITNAVNIADGMDGLSAGLLLPAFSAYLYFAVVDGNNYIALLIATVIGSLLGYLYFNIKPARIEFGDVGTLALGALLAAVAFALRKEMLLPIIGFLFVAEIGSSLVQGIYRKIVGRRLFKMAPLHLHFQIIGWSEEKIVMRFWLIAVVFALVGVLIGIVG